MHVDESQGIVLGVDLSGEVPTVPMTINKSIPVEAMIDSGDLMEVALAEDLRKKYHLAMLVDPDPNNYNKSHVTISGIAGEETMECGTVDSISLGPIVYEAPPSCYSRTILSNNQAIVGFDFISNFNIVFDYPHGKMILIPRKNQ